MDSGPACAAIVPGEGFEGLLALELGEKLRRRSTEKEPHDTRRRPAVNLEWPDPATARHAGSLRVSLDRMGAPGDGIEMNTASVLAQMSTLRYDGEDLDLAWSTVRRQIDADETGVGNDELGTAFWATYEPDSVRLSNEAVRVAQALQASAQIGEQCAWLYRAADANGRGGMPGTPR
jgi:hypothetical protein